MDKIDQLEYSDESIIYQYKFNIDKIQENELTKKYIFDNILESEIQTLDIELFYVHIKIEVDDNEYYNIKSTFKFDIIDYKFYFHNFTVLSKELVARTCSLG
jgi:hypothetical protein